MSDYGTNQCATDGCDRKARWYSIPEGNRFGNNAPRRCVVCCNAIGEAGDAIFREIAIHADAADDELSDWEAGDVVTFTDDDGQAQVAKRTDYDMGGTWQVCLHGFRRVSDDYIDAHNPTQLLPENRKDV